MDLSDDVSHQPQSDQLALPASNDATTMDNMSSPKTNNSDIINMKELLDLALQFLSTCSNEMLLFILALLIGATYIVLGRLGLIIIGIIIGIALHASWDGPGNHPVEFQRSNRRQLSLHVTHRLLDWQTSRHAEHDRNFKDDGEHMPEKTSNSGFNPSYGPATASALQSLVDAAVRDYVNYWYEPILPSESTFPISCRRTMIEFINSLSSHLCRKRTADTFLEFLTNSSSMVIVFLNELSTAFEAAGPAATAEDAISRYLDSNPDSSLANLLEKQQQQRKLKMISDDILSRFLEQSAYKCTPLRTFFREILAGVALESTIVSMSRPEFINGWITYLFSEGESEIMNVIDAGVEGARTHGITGANVSGEHARLASVSVKSDVGEPHLPAEPPVRAPDRPDKATEEAMLEAKRLSAMIAAQAPKDVWSDRGTEERTKDQRPSLESSVIEGPEHTQNVEPSSWSGELDSEGLDASPAFTLYRASITVDDGMDSSEKTLFRVKPSSSHMIQVETRSGRSTGWMVFRKYADFESIHETLGTISRLNQLQFGDSHPVVPPWKGQTRQALARNLGRYLQDALQLEPLAESMTMRRFLDKDGALGAEPAELSTNTGFVFPGQTAFENVGKGVLGGGKAVFEGVSGVFGSANKKASVAAGSKNENKVTGGGLRKSDPPLVLGGSGGSEIENPSLSSDAADGAFPSQMPGSPSPSEAATQSSDTPMCTPESEENTVGESTSRDLSNPISIVGTDFPKGRETKDATIAESRIDAEKSAERKVQSSPITADETRMAVELIFAVINELYSLSSAWNIRRTLLNAAKSYILRPGNPSLEIIRNLLQESMIDSHSSDDAICVYLTKLRENALPTAEELSAWPPPISESEQERRREAARRVLVQKGLPHAITSVMGAVASREALGRIFDSLQIEVVARGLIFSIFLQALRAVAL
ncbi:PXA domain-containing protein [Aspergillus pseudoustus]|uniref:PXA domain-containing protein n=1 Tax=Aspergillus pseudoustus TaxID=1810923 RepID=A0ABR4JSI7_9EURO